MFIAFLTDFGLRDDFVGTCHGVIKRIAPEAQIIDVTHQITAQDVEQGAASLAAAIPYLPVGVHLALVDPMRGGSSRGVVVETGDGCLLVFTHVFNPEFGPGWQHAAGWDTYLNRLDVLLAGGFLSEEEAHEGIQERMASYRERFEPEAKSGILE